MEDVQPIHGGPIAEQPLLRNGSAQCHRYGTAEVICNRFTYRRIGPDFLDTWTGVEYELTTAGSMAEHMLRPGYETATYAIYHLISSGL